MKKILNIIAVALLTASTASCERDITYMNKDPKHVSVVPSGNLLSMGMYQEFYYMYSGNVNNNNYRFFTQQWSEVTYTDESNYDLTTRYQPRNHYTRMMVYTLNNFEQGKKNLETEITASDAERNNKWATLELSELFTWENVVDTWGDVPYFDALKANSGQFAPKYDDAKIIYTDLLKRIDAAIAKIDTGVKGYATEDLVYAGDMSKWKKMANSLKLRLAMNLADVDAAASRKAAEEAVAGGLITRSDNYQLTMDGSTYLNPLYEDVISSGRFDFVPSDRVINLMNSKNDPRLPVWFVPVGTTGKYVGGPFGSSSSPTLPSTTVSVFTNYFTSKTGPVNLLSFTEVEFLLAEAAARGYSVGGTAADLYTAAVTASMTENGIAGSAAAYLAANPYNAADWKKSIGEEVYIALFNRAFAAWNFTRRLDMPTTLVNPSTSKISGIPVRMPYSDQEYTLNKANVEAAAAKIGKDDATTKLFWDKY